MKTYLLDSINRYKRFSENLDIKTVLCNKSWWVFNDLGEKEIYIFQEDGSLIISINGQVTNANWKFISANKSLIINTPKQSVMVHAEFMDNVIFALQVDGTNQFSFLIDESNRDSFLPKSLSDVENYFETKEARVEAKRTKKIEQVQLERKEKKQLENKKQIEDVYKRKLQTIAVRIEYSEQYIKWKKSGRLWRICNIFFFIFGFILFTVSLGCAINYKGLFLFLLIAWLAYPILVAPLLFGQKDKRRFELIFRNKNGASVKYDGEQLYFEVECLRKAFSALTVRLDNNVTENIVSYMGGRGELEISYFYKRQIIGVDSYDLGSIN